MLWLVLEFISRLIVIAVVLTLVAGSACAWYELVWSPIAERRRQQEYREKRKLRQEQFQRDPSRATERRIQEAENSVHRISLEIIKLERQTISEEERTKAEARLAESKKSLEAAKAGYVRPKPLPPKIKPIIPPDPLKPILSQNKIQSMATKAMHRIAAMASSEREQAWSEWEAEIDKSIGPLAAQEVKLVAANLRERDVD